MPSSLFRRQPDAPPSPTRWGVISAVREVYNGRGMFDCSQSSIELIWMEVEFCGYYDNQVRWIRIRTSFHPIELIWMEVDKVGGPTNILIIITRTFFFDRQKNLLFIGTFQHHILSTINEDTFCNHDTCIDVCINNTMLELYSFESIYICCWRA